MARIDNIAIIWTIAIVAAGVGFTSLGGSFQSGDSNTQSMESRVGTEVTQQFSERAALTLGSKGDMRDKERCYDDPIKCTGFGMTQNIGESGSDMIKEPLIPTPMTMQKAAQMEAQALWDESQRIMGSPGKKLTSQQLEALGNIKKLFDTLSNGLNKMSTTYSTDKNFVSAMKMLGSDIQAASNLLGKTIETGISPAFSERAPPGGATKG